MMDSLITKAHDPSPAVAANVLIALGELACVGGEDVLHHVPQLMSIILDILEDPSVPIKRDAALVALGQICSSTGYVIQPLIDHPQLLGYLGKILKAEQSPPTRREVMKLLGILGALDPYKRGVCFHLLITFKRR
jgi:FKBP12-rapamycin complex-associated protein